MGSRCSKSYNEQKDAIKNKLISFELNLYFIGEDLSTIYDYFTIQKKQDNLLPSHQRLIFGGKQLEDDKTLMDYNIQNEATLHLVVRLKGGQTIYVKTLIGDVFTFEFDENQTIAEVKQKIEETENIPVNEQRLFFNNKQLADNKTLKEYKIEEEDTIQLVLRKR